LLSIGQAIYQQSLIRIAAEQQLQANIDAEANARANADSVIINALNSEVSTRSTDDATLQANIDAEATARGDADTVLNDAIVQEAIDRTNADNTLQSNIDGKEPSIIAGLISQYWSGTKTWRDLSTDVRAVVLTGLSLITSTAITAADTILVSLGKLQAQINAQSVLIANKQDNILPGTVNDYWRGDKTWQPSLGLPVSTATLTALNLKQNSSLSPLRIRGRWHIPSEFAFALGTGSLTLNTIFGLAVRFTEPTTISDLGFIASSGVGGALANIGIYDSDANGEPGNLVASASNINCTSSGSKSVTLASPVVLPVGKYYFVILSSATLNVTSSGISSLAVIGNATLVATTVTGITKALAFTSLPASFGAYTTTAQANIPFVWFKTA
jgi:hypothetical protein